MSQYVRAVETSSFMPVVGPYALATIVEAGAELVFVSGMLPLDPANGRVLEGDAGMLTEQIMENIKVVLSLAGSSLSSIVRVEIFCTDIKNDFSMINSVYEKYFSNTRKPSRQTIQVAALPLGATIEISCIAVVEKGRKT